MRTKVLISVLVLLFLLTSCNMPVGQTPITQPAQNESVSADSNAMATAVELTAIARVTQIAGSAVPATPAPTWTSAPSVPVSGPCTPLVTATVNANVRSGPDTAYDIVGSLTLGQTATIVGRNDAYTWWYIDYPGVAGNHAWIAGSVVASSCVPDVVQVVGAPPLPTAVAAEAASDDEEDNDDEGGISVVQIPDLNVPLHTIKFPDLIVVGMQLDPSSPVEGQTVEVKIKVKNQGVGDAGSFKVKWWAGSSAACGWTVPSLAVGASDVVTCSHTFTHAGDWPIKALVDSASAVTESNEDNNMALSIVHVKIKLMPLPWP